MHPTKLKRVTVSIIAACALAASFTAGCLAETKHVHDLKYSAGADRTCVVPGLAEHWHCNTCGRNFSDENAENELETVSLPKLEHVYNSYTYDEEYHYRKCSLCSAASLSSKSEHLLHYIADEMVHFSECHCGYKSTPALHTADSADKPCSVCHYGGLTFELSEGGDYYICTGAAEASKKFVTEFIVPDEHLGLPVKEIGELAFADCSSLEKITFGKNVLSIGDRAFRNCTALTGLFLNDGLMEINPMVFYNCTSLKEVELPNSIKSIGSYAFNACKSLERVNIPEGVTSVSMQTFLNCTSLAEIGFHAGIKEINTAAFSGTAVTRVVLPEGLGAIPMTAFLNCKKLESVTIPASVKSIGAAAFGDCTALKEIIFLGTSEEWSAINFVDFPQMWNHNTGDYTITFSKTSA